MTDRLRALLRDREPVRMQAPEPKDITNGVVQLRLYDVIDDWGGPYGVSAKEVADVLDALPDDVTEIRLHINSPGGIASEGVAILNLLRQHPARVVAVVDGLAASAASLIACGADETVMARNSELMIHAAWGVVVGNADDMREVADRLDHLTRNLAQVYADKAGGNVEEWLAAMKAESWYMAEEAVAAGLADRVLDVAADETAKNRFDLRVFAHAGREHAPAPRSPAPPSASGSTTTAQEADMSLSDALRERLGIADENADEGTILAALDEALSEQADPPKNDGTPDPATLAEITRMSTELAEMRAQAAQRTKDEHFVSWLRDGKTSPAERAELEALYDAAPERTVALVSARAVGSVVPVATVGHGEPGDEAFNEAEYAAFAASLGITQKGA
jgi:ATP-dependent Clp endopeptidase proteolytic subunit ClpP